MKFKEFKFLHFEKRWVLPLAMASIISIFLFTVSLNLGTENKLNSFRIGSNKTGSFAEDKIQFPPPPPRPTVPRFTYLVSGSKIHGRVIVMEDLNKLWRTVRPLYHPWKSNCCDLCCGSGFFVVVRA
ncbi:hypothetical protein HanIR_Chr07g0323591 [Helianthus annuus]|nr:hypothetical protein HanIR_Chr07g0323591 [Helianthus annuus]